MKITKGKFDPTTRIIPVTFAEGAIRHTRAINAVVKDDGSLDKEATQAIIEDQARGVAYKIAIGVIRAEPPPS